MDMPGGNLSGIPELSLNLCPKGKGWGNPFQPHIPWILYSCRFPALPLPGPRNSPLFPRYFLPSSGTSGKNPTSLGTHPWWNSPYPTWIIPEVLSFSISLWHSGRFQRGSGQWWNSVHKILLFQLSWQPDLARESLWNVGSVEFINYTCPGRIRMFPF